jgi:transposase
MVTRSRENVGAVTGRTRWKRKDPHNERGRIAIRYRAYPTADQQSTARRIDGCCRVVQNLAKEQRDTAWRNGRRRVSYSAQAADLKELRDDPNLASWLSEAPVQILQQALRDTHIAYSRFFQGIARYPAWATKSGWVSFRDPQKVQVRRTSRRWGEVKLQGVGWVRVRLHRRPFNGRVCSATYIEEPDRRAFISVLFEKHRREPTKPLVDDWNTTVGVDRGVAVAVATSDGDLNNRYMWTFGETRRLKRLEQQRERKKIARTKANKRRPQDQGLNKSNKQRRTENSIATLHARARRRRRDFNEQLSNTLAKNHRLVVFEDLHIPAMTATARGTKDNPGSNVAQKAGLNRAILDKGWGMLQSRCRDKTVSHGHLVAIVPAPFTSITCPECEVIDKASRASRSMFACVHCGYHAHADLAAADNIREQGIKLALAGGTPVTALPGSNRGPELPGGTSGVEPSALAGHGSGNQKTGCITDRVVA